VKATINDCLQIAFSVAELGNDPLKRNLLAYLSVLPPIQIEYSVLTRLFQVSSEEETKFQNALTFLVERGWLEETLVEETHLLYMHPVIQLTLRKKLKPTATKISGLIRELANLISTNSYETRSVEELLLYTPFVESIIEHLPANDEGVADLYESYASISRELYGDREKALDYAWRAYSLRKKVESADLIGIAASANGLAIELRNKREFSTALGLSQEAIEIMENILDPDPDQLKKLATYYQNQGQILRGQLKTQEAIDLFEKSMMLLQKHQLDHPHLVAAANNNIGLVYNNQRGDYRAALPYYQKAVRIAKASEDPKVYHYYNNLADCLIDNGLLSDALQYQLRVVEQYEKAPNKEKNGHLAIAYKVLSDIYAALGGDNNISYALDYQQKAIFIKRNINSPVSLAISLTAMAKLHKADSSYQDLTKAINFQKQANDLFLKQGNSQILTGLEILLELHIKSQHTRAAQETFNMLLEQARLFLSDDQIKSLTVRWQEKL
jgi:tetratricopeptide (TPR) repeat protein